MKKLMIIEGSSNKKFAEKINDVFADPNIEVIQTTYFNSLGEHYAYIEYKTKGAETQPKQGD
jgi:hypothetical protein